jgi:pimeloyl-ACP methyl ester carboxylesterase
MPNFHPTLIRSSLVLAIGLTGLTGCASLPHSATVALPAGKPVSYYAQSGAGPTVIFQSGLGDGKNVWAQVIQQLPASTALLAYDRPGYGDSPSSTDARDPCTIAQELHQLTRALALKPPFILVGHSLGGLYQHCYAQRYPDEVAGMVLIDPTHSDHLAELKKQAPAQAALLSALRYSVFSGTMRDEFDAQAASNDYLYGHKTISQPVLFLFSGKFRPEERGDFEKMTRQLRRLWQAAAPASSASEVSHSGHYIQKEAPEQVVRAILQLRGNAPR